MGNQSNTESNHIIDVNDERFNAVRERTRELALQAETALRGLGFREEEINGILFAAVAVAARELLEKRQKRKQEQSVSEHKM